MREPKRLLVPHNLREQLIKAASEQGFCDRLGNLYYSNLETRWNTAKKSMVLGACPSRPTLRKFFRENEGHHRSVIDGLCRLLLGQSFAQWKRSNRQQVRENLFALSGRNALDGLWLSQYGFFDSLSGGKDDRPTQFNLELLTITQGKVKGESLAQVSNRRNTHLLKYEGKLFPRGFLSGNWSSQNGDLVGCFLLHVEPDGTAITGKVLGFAKDNSIVTGTWVWVKIQTSQDGTVDMLSHQRSSIKLRDFSLLAESFTEALQESYPLEVEEVFNFKSSY